MLSHLSSKSHSNALDFGLQARPLSRTRNRVAGQRLVDVDQDARCRLLVQRGTLLTHSTGVTWVGSP